MQTFLKLVNNYKKYVSVYVINTLLTPLLDTEKWK